MKTHFKFRYRSRFLNNFYIALTNLLISIPAVIAGIVIVEVIDYFSYFLVWLPSLIVFVALEVKYYIGHKGANIEEKGITVNFCCIDIPIHSFKKYISYKSIEKIEICTDNVSNRIESVFGGAYKEPYVKIVYGYQGRSDILLPLREPEEFIERVNELRATS